jgi:hypothetical protein
VNDAKSAVAKPVRFFKVSLNRNFDVARRERVQVQNVSDGYFDRIFALHATVATGAEFGATNHAAVEHSHRLS